VDTLSVPLWTWAVTVAAVIVLAGADLALGIRRRKRDVRLREAALGTVTVVALAVAFGIALAWLGHPAAAGQFFAGWVTEYSLSLDNLFIFVLLINRSAVPSGLHSPILMLGVFLALLLRGIFIAVGAAALHAFGWVLYLFGALLIYSAVRLAFGRPGDGTQAGEGTVARMTRRILPVSPECDGARLTTRVRGRIVATPVLVLILAIAATDLMFAVDSIPAIFGLTREPYLVFTANAFALLGLRYLYFLVGGMLSRLAHLSAGLSIILGFIGVKLITEALLESGISGVGPLAIPRISTGLSLAVIAGVIVIVTITSLLASRQAGRA